MLHPYRVVLPLSSVFPFPRKVYHVTLQDCERIVRFAQKGTTSEYLTLVDAYIEDAMGDVSFIADFVPIMTGKGLEGVVAELYRRYLAICGMSQGTDKPPDHTPQG